VVLPWAFCFTGWYRRKLHFVAPVWIAFKISGKSQQNCGELRLDYLARLQAGSAYAHTLMRALHNGAYLAQVYIPAPAAHIVRVADGISKLRSLAAHFTYSGHNESLQKLTQKGFKKTSEL
jgi:hypothetical protein